MTNAEIHIPPIAEVLGERVGADPTDEQDIAYNAWITARVLEALKVHDRVTVVYADGETDVIAVDREGDVVAVTVEVGV